MNRADYARELLKICPGAGAGVHAWLFKVARALHSLHSDEGKIIELIKAASSGCGRQVTRREIENAVLNSSPDKEKDRVRVLPWPAADKVKISEITSGGPSAEDLRGLSPVKFDRALESQSETIVDALFPGNPLLCVGNANCDKTAPRERENWRGLLATRQFIVPSPMVSKRGKTQAGDATNRGLEMVGPRRFLVIEFDPVRYHDLPPAEQRKFGEEADYYKMKQDDQAALLHHLAQFGPLALVVHSGGKSLHGWFYCCGQDEARLRDFMRYAVSLGADKATFTKNQWVRLPDGQRREEIKLPDGRQRRVKKMQTTIYFNPGVLPQ